MPKRPSHGAATWILLAVAGLACDMQPPRPAAKPTVAKVVPGAPAPVPSKDEPKKKQPKAEPPPVEKTVVIPPRKSKIVPVGINEAKKRAIASVNGGNFEAAIKLLREGLQSSPNDREGLFLIAAMLKDQAEKSPEGKARHEQFLEAGRFAHSLYDSVKGELLEYEQIPFNGIFYAEARALAAGGKPEDAKKSLELAATLGFEDLDQLDAEKDLESVRKLPGFAGFKASLAGKADSVIKARAKVELAGFKSFPFDFNLRTIDDKPIKLDDLKGKVVIVDIWATWCAPCLKEIPHFRDLYGKYKGKGLEIVGLNYEHDSEPKDAIRTIRAFLKNVPIPYPLAIGDEATQSKVPNFSAYPTTLFIDRTGKVRLMLEGYTAMPRLDAIVRTLLDETP